MDFRYNVPRSQWEQYQSDICLLCQRRDPGVVDSTLVTGCNNSKATLVTQTFTFLVAGRLLVGVCDVIWCVVPV